MEVAFEVSYFPERFLRGYGEEAVVNRGAYDDIYPDPRPPQVLLGPHPCRQQQPPFFSHHLNLKPQLTLLTKTPPLGAMDNHTSAS